MIAGACHCGNISFEIETAIATADIVARSCDCDFCGMHAATTWSDPDGNATVYIRDSSNLQRYRFALNTADFYICTTCGAYVGAVLTDGDESWSTLNLRLSALQPNTKQAAYGQENTAARIARRKQRWTPTTIE